MAAVHERFLPQNARFQDAVTRWQIRPLPGAPMATNDHTDHRWDDDVLEVLGSVGRRLDRLETDLTAVLPRFGGYGRRYGRALDGALRGEDRWVDGVGIDSCHVVWMQLHEDLLATLGVDRAHRRGLPECRSRPARWQARGSRGASVRREAPGLARAGGARGQRP